MNYQIRIGQKLFRGANIAALLRRAVEAHRATPTGSFRTAPTPAQLPGSAGRRSTDAL